MVSLLGYARIALVIIVVPLQRALYLTVGAGTE